MIPKKITLKKTVALVMCLAKLHNFCIDERETSISPLTAVDEATIELDGAVPLQHYDADTDEGQFTAQQGLPLQLIDAGNHFDDMPVSVRRQRKRELQRVQRELDEMLPRDRMHFIVRNKQLRRPSKLNPNLLMTYTNLQTLVHFLSQQ